MLGASLPREGTGNGLEVFSGTCQANVGSCRTCTPRRTDSEMSTCFAMRLAALLTRKPNVGSFTAQRGHWQWSGGVL